MMMGAGDRSCPGAGNVQDHPCDEPAGGEGMMTRTQRRSRMSCSVVPSTEPLDAGWVRSYVAHVMALHARLALGEAA